MKVLFISSGRNNNDISELIRNQGESLKKEGIDLEYFIIKQRGLLGYIKSVPEIRNIFKSGGFDLAHAHYSLSAIAASAAGRFPLIVSLMGSDVYGKNIGKLFIRLLHKYWWDATIVKTAKMNDKLKLKNAFVIPNGIDLGRFKIIPKEIAREKLGYHSNNRLILFISNPKRPEKNFKLALDSVKALKIRDVEFMTVYNTPNTEIPYYMNAADALLLTSIWEGSVNVVKEAMACNLPVVSTDVGDVKINLGESSNSYVCENFPDSLAEGLRKVLTSSDRSNGRQRIMELGLDSKRVAKEIIEVYDKVMNKGSSK